MAEQKMLHPYPEYKDSGVEWLGKIPAHWDLLRLKNAVVDCVNGFWGDEPKNNEEDIIVLRVADFNRDQLNISDEKLTYRNISFSDQQRRLLKKGDLLIEKSGGGDKTLVGCVVLFDKPYKAITSNFVAKMSPQNGFDSRFVLHAFNILYSGDVNYRSIKQTTGIQNLDTNAYLDELFSFPPLPEQQKIADFLDDETEQMDRLIAKQERLIELLGEKRQAVISHAVTKGLNPDAPMKDSGVEWIGEIPAHWEKTKVKHKANISGRIGFRGYSQTDIVDDYTGAIVYGPGNIQNSEISNENLRFLSWEKYHESPEIQVKVGDIMMVKTGSTYGKTALVKSLIQETTINPQMVLFKNFKGNPGYLSYLFNSKQYQNEISILNTGSGMPTLTQENIGDLIIYLPNNIEQEKIVQFLDTELAKMDALTAKAEQQIELLKERRRALISAAVTGKIDLRHWQSPPIKENDKE